KFHEEPAIIQWCKLEGTSPAPYHSIDGGGVQKLCIREIEIREDEYVCTARLRQYDRRPAGLCPGNLLEYGLLFHGALADGGMRGDPPGRLFYRAPLSAAPGKATA